MLRLSKMTDYGLVILHYLADHDNTVLSAAAIASDVKLALPTVSKILKLLVNAELVRSVRGSHGGYQLFRPAKNITIPDVIMALEGSMPALTDCSHAQRKCEHDAFCQLRDNWNIINQTIMRTLQNISLQDLLKPLCPKTLALKDFRVELELIA